MNILGVIKMSRFGMVSLVCIFSFYGHIHTGSNSASLPENNLRLATARLLCRVIFLPV